MLDETQEERVMAEQLAILKDQLGVKPAGYRSPSWDVNVWTPALLKRNGFLYDSSMMAEISPYRISTPDGASVVELPWHWSLDDAPFALFSIKSPRPIFPNSHIREVWQEEFREIHRWGGYYNLVMHPQVTGRPSRIALLRDMIGFMRGFEGVWFATCTQGAEAWAATQR